MNTSTPPSEIIIPENATSATGESSLGDVWPLNDPIQRDPLYYDAPLIILVEAILFKIPRGYFENVDTFRMTYLFDPDGGELSDGHTDQQPLRLDGVDAAAFRCLLKAIIREDSEKDMSWTEWTSILKLSQMWKMKPIYDLAIRKVTTRIQNSDEWIAALKTSTQLRMRDFREVAIGKLAGQLTSALQKIELGIEYKIQSWLLEGYTEFVKRDKVISLEDEAQLGWIRTCDLFRVRHRRLQQLDYYYDVQTDIQNTFAEEFADTLAAESAINWSPISYLRPELHIATDPGVIRRDEEYYCVEIIFSVEGILFKLPRYLFEESSDVFRDMFSLPAPEGTSYDGCSDEQPLFLEGVRRMDFRHLLKAMKFPAKYQASRRLPYKKIRGQKKGLKKLRNGSSEELMSWVEWRSVLKLSCMWQITQVQEMAVQKILELLNQADVECQKDLLRLSNKLGITKIRDRAIEILSRADVEPVEWIQRGREFQVDSWLLKGYQQLIQASAGISVEHGELFERKTTSKLFRIRDAYLQIQWDGDYSSAAIDNATAQIKEAFSEEFEAAVWVGN